MGLLDLKVIIQTKTHKGCEIVFSIDGQGNCVGAVHKPKTVCRSCSNNAGQGLINTALLLAQFSENKILL